MGTLDNAEAKRLRGVLTDIAEATKPRGVFIPTMYATLLMFTCVFLLGRLQGTSTYTPTLALFQTSSSSSSSSSGSGSGSSGSSRGSSIQAQPPSSSTSSSSSTSTSTSSTCNCPREWLASLAPQSDTSFVYEDVLRAKLLHPCCSHSNSLNPPAAAPSLDRILFVVMCSKDMPHRVTDMVAGWLHWVPPESVILLCGAEIPGLNVTLLPPLAIDDGMDARFNLKKQSGKKAANLRHLRSIWWLVNERSAVLQSFDWVFYVDDDTFVNVPLLLSFLHGMPAHLPLLVSHIHSNRTKPRNLAFPSGGSGMLFTRLALQQLGSVLFSPLCQVGEAVNDITIGRCCWPANITRVHSTRFLTEVKCLNQSGGNPPRLDVGMVVSTHYVKTRELGMEFTCLVAARFGWPHPLCGRH